MRDVTLILPKNPGWVNNRQGWMEIFLLPNASQMFMDNGENNIRKGISSKYKVNYLTFLK